MSAFGYVIGLLAAVTMFATGLTAAEIIRTVRERVAMRRRRHSAFDVE